MNVGQKKKTRKRVKHLSQKVTSQSQMDYLSSNKEGLRIGSWSLLECFMFCSLISKLEENDAEVCEKNVFHHFNATVHLAKEDMSSIQLQQKSSKQVCMKQG